MRSREDERESVKRKNLKWGIHEIKAMGDRLWAKIQKKNVLLLIINIDE